MRSQWGGLSFPSTSRPASSAEHRFLHTSVMQQEGLYQELRDITSFFAEPLGSPRYSEHCLHNTNLFPPLQE